jgi:hypothetical protein
VFRCQLADTLLPRLRPRRRLNPTAARPIPPRKAGLDGMGAGAAVTEHPAAPWGEEDTASDASVVPGKQ